MYETNSVTTKGQVTIPKRIRDALNIHPGVKVSFKILKNGFYIEKTKTIEDMAGFLSYKGKKVTQKQIDKNIQEQFIKDYN